MLSLGSGVRLAGRVNLPGETQGFRFLSETRLYDALNAGDGMALALARR